MVHVGIHAAAFGGLDQGVDRHGAATALSGAREQPELAASDDVLQRFLYEVVVDAEVTLHDVARQRAEDEIGVGNRLAEGALGQEARFCGDAPLAPGQVHLNEAGQRVPTYTSSRSAKHTRFTHDKR